MQGIDATFDELSFEGGDSPRRVLLKIVPGGAAVALAAALGVWVLHLRDSDALFSRWTPASSAPAISKPFGDIVIDKALLAQLKLAAPAALSPQVARLGAVPPRAPFPLPGLEAAPPVSPAPFTLPGLEPFSPAPGPAIPPVASLPPPPERGTPEIGESFPLPPPRPPEIAAPAQPRPPEIAAPAQPQAPERHAARPEVAVARPAAPADNRNILQKLFGLGRSTSSVVGSAAPARATSRPVVGEQREREATGLARGPWFAFLSPFGHSAPVSGYDRYTAVYDISARTVTLPDGTRLEAHSGLGDALDNPRYVSVRARGPTPPHVYELTLREGSFHGVQAIRLNPIGDGGIYGREGFLAHPFMLGPKGASNGCVSFKDYNAFLRAYENGQIKKLAVVAGL